MKKHIIDGLTFNEDWHNVIEDCDFSPLDKLYEGRKAYYGDYHCHTDSGGTSDGKMTPESWLKAMKEFKLDFAGIMDHRQVRHMYLDCFDEEYFICGTEPGGKWNDPELSFHYLMIVPEREALVRVLEKFPDVYNFTGGIEGTYDYIKVDRDRFLEVVKAVRDEGGVVVHPHPKQVMKSEDPRDYYFGEGSVIEVMYTYDPPSLANEMTKNNYKLWMDMLSLGYKVINTATNDSHRQTMLVTMNTVYSAEKKGRAYMEYLRKGDLNAGFFGIKMSIDDNPVGSSAKYKDGMKLYIKVEDVHTFRFDRDETYRIDVLSDEGIVYSSVIELPFKVAMEVKDRKFYRAVIIRESDGAPVAIGNPIWLDK